jgi:addiction module RelE/StbE family toxin
VKIVFSKGAHRDLLDTVKYISKDKPEAALNWATEIKKSVTKLSDYPRLGRIVPEFSDESIREIIKGQYRIVYKIDIEKDALAILAVHHSKKLLL